MFRKACVISLFVAGLAGCSNLPDIKRAEQKAAQGNVEYAREQLEELARFGLADAQVELGDLYAEEDNPAAQERAARWYGKAAEQGSDRAWIRLGKMYARDGKTASQRAQGAGYLKEALAGGDDTALIPLINLYLEYPDEFANRNPRKLIDRARAKGDPAGDYALARYYLLSGHFDSRAEEIESLCVPIVEAQPQCFQVLARVYMTQNRSEELDALVKRATASWQSGTLDDRDLYLFARWLSDDESPQPQVATTNDLYLLLTPSYVPALTARARLIMENTYLADADVVIDMLTKARASGDMKASLALARAYERGRIVPTDPKQAIRYAEEARDKYASADYLLGRIYRRGYLGEPNPEKAQAYLLTAARRGFPKADFTLAELYWEGKGVAVNRRYAWSFALLALDGGVERARELLKEMLPSLPRNVELAAEQLYKREKTARQQMLVGGTGVSGNTERQGG